MTSQKSTSTLLLLLLLFLDVKVCRCDEQFDSGVVDEVFNTGQRDRGSKEKQFILKVWPKVSGIVPVSVKIPSFRKNVGTSEWSRQLLGLQHPIYPFFLGTIESDVGLKVGDVLNAKFEDKEDHTFCEVDAELEFKNPVNFKIYTEDSHGKKSEPMSINYSFKGQNIVKFQLMFPNFLKGKILRDCIVHVESISVATLSTPTVEQGTLDGIQVNDMGETFWNIMKEGGIYTALTLGIMNTMQSKPPVDTPRTEEKVKTKVSWVCLGDHFDQRGDKGISKQSKLSQLMESMQLAVEQSVSSVASNPPKIVLMSDFTDAKKYIVTLNTPGMTGKKQTFSFTNFAPDAFRSLRNYFGMKEEEFLVKFCKVPLKEISSTGRSGSVFFISENKYFISKTVSSKEVDTLQKFLPGYFLYLFQNPVTLLPKFYGIYWLKQSLMTSSNLLVMNNIMPPNIVINVKYDLKGSIVNRKLSEKDLLQSSTPTMKDVDFMTHHPQGIFLRADDYKKIMFSIQSDSLMLQSFQIVDYSLLLGVQYEDQVKDGGDFPSKDGKTFPCEQHHEGNSMNGKSKGHTGDKDSIQSGIHAWTPEGEKLSLFLGIIDILEKYNFKKKLEYFFKSLIYKSNTISVQQPVLFARRFENFIGTKVFKVLPPCPVG